MSRWFIGMLISLSLIGWYTPAQAADDELALARELVSEREALDRMRADTATPRAQIQAQERKLAALRARLSAAMAEQLAAESADTAQQLLGNAVRLLREKLRSLLDESREAKPGQQRT